jgi:GNAT superfamily N-acetyltransferase
VDRAFVLADFDAQMRADPPAELGVERAWVDGVLRTTGAYNLIGWWDFPAARAMEIAAREAAFFAGQDLEWKVFSHDGPPGLEAALAASGFAPDRLETFLVLDLDAAPALGADHAMEVRRVTDEAGAADVAAVHAAAFGRETPGRLEQLAARLGDPTQALFVAYEGRRPVSSGRLELAPGRAFAGLYGGGTVPDYRGRGAYRALVAARAAEARRRGCRYLTVDALETSRPILERLGFQPLATVRAWMLAPPAEADPPLSR